VIDCFGKVTPISPDIRESTGKTLPFGQVLMLGGPRLKDEDQALLEWTKHVSDKKQKAIWSEMYHNVCGAGLAKR